MELRGNGTTRCRLPVGAIPPTTQENRVKRSITIDPTVGSRSKVFHEFPEAVFDGVAWNRNDTLTASGRGHSTDYAREPGQKVHNYGSDSWIVLKFFSRVSRGCFRWSSEETVRHDDVVRSGPFHRQDHSTGSKGPYLKIRPLDRAQLFSRVSVGYFQWSSVKSVRHADAVRSGPFHRHD